MCVCVYSFSRGGGSESVERSTSELVDGSGGSLIFERFRLINDSDRYRVRNRAADGRNRKK